MTNKMCGGQIEYLPWDSDFFAQKTGRVFIDNSGYLENHLIEAANNGYHLIYVFGNKNFFIDKNILRRFNGKLADKKILYEKEVMELKERSPVVCEYKDNILTAELESLAYEAGKYSRFKLDDNFGENDFRRLYKMWIDKSVKHQIADNVFVVREDNIIKGFITLKKDEKGGNIGLCALSPDIQGEGRGKALINACENELRRAGICSLYVSTQADNTQACKFYEKCGFQIKEITNIYHFWIGYETQHQ